MLPNKTANRQSDVNLRTMAAISPAAKILFTLARLPGALPLGWLRGLAGAFSRWLYRRNRVLARVTRRNYELVAPEQTTAERELAVQATLQSSAWTMAESLAIWTRDRERNVRRVVADHGLAHLQVAEQSGKGTIIIAPHFGNWELLVQYMAARGAFSLIYRPAENRIADGFLRIARERHGVKAVPAEGHALRPLIAALRRGETVGITPDQLPSEGAGQFAEFFGRPALTMSLISRLLQSTGANALFGFTQRRNDGDFEIHFSPAAENLSGTDLPQSLAALNHGVQHIAMRCMSQYQWTYKRYKRGPAGDGSDNPYWPDCYD